MRLLLLIAGAVLSLNAAWAQTAQYRLQPLSGPLPYASSAALVVERTRLDGGVVSGSEPAATVALSTTSATGEFTATPGDDVYSATASVSFGVGASTAAPIYFRDSQLSGGTLRLDAGASPAIPTSYSVGAQGMATDFESALLYGPNPTAPYRSMSVDSANCTVTLSPDAGHRGAQGLRATHSVAASGPNGGAYVMNDVANLMDTHYTRAWLRQTSTNNVDGIIVLNFHPAGGGSPMLGLTIDYPGLFLGLESFGVASVYDAVTGTVSIADGGWRLVELETSGGNTAAGTARLFVDGALSGAQLSGVNWTGMTIHDLVVGLVWINDLAWVGSVDLDDVRLSSAPPASRLLLSVTSAVSEGQCTSARVSLTESFFAGQATAPYAMVVDLGASAGNVTWFSDPGCASPASTATIAAGAPFADAYFIASSAGPATLTVNHQDLLPAAPLALIVQPPGVGGADGGVDGGNNPDLRYLVGCDCAGAPGVPFAIALLVAVRRVHRLRKSVRAADEDERGEAAHSA